MRRLNSLYLLPFVKGGPAKFPVPAAAPLLRLSFVRVPPSKPEGVFSFVNSVPSFDCWAVSLCLAVDSIPVDLNKMRKRKNDEYWRKTEEREEAKLHPRARVNRPQRNETVRLGVRLTEPPFRRKFRGFLGKMSKINTVGSQADIAPIWWLLWPVTPLPRRL
jgi:hypothetical protein